MLPNRSTENHDAHDYAERIRERLPRRHQELREGIGLSMHAPWLKCGVSRDTISRIQGGETIPSVHVLGRFRPEPTVILCAERLALFPSLRA